MEEAPRSVVDLVEASAVVLVALAAEASVVVEQAEAGRTCVRDPRIRCSLHLHLVHKIMTLRHACLLVDCLSFFIVLVHI